MLSLRHTLQTCSRHYHRALRCVHTTTHRPRLLRLPAQNAARIDAVLYFLLLSCQQVSEFSSILNSLRYIGGVMVVACIVGSTHGIHQPLSCQLVNFPQLCMVSFRSCARWAHCGGPQGECACAGLLWHGRTPMTAVAKLPRASAQRCTNGLTLCRVKSIGAN